MNFIWLVWFNESENDFVENLYDHGIFFWYWRIKETNENIIIFQPYVSLIVSGFKQDFTQWLQHKLWYFKNGENFNFSFFYKKIVKENEKYFEIFMNIIHLKMESSKLRNFSWDLCWSCPYNMSYMTKFKGSCLFHIFLKCRKV